MSRVSRETRASDVKTAFGRCLREARDAKRLSRASLGLRLGISPKTIQSWEMGRTFIEDLSLIPSIESELAVSFSELIARAVGLAAGGPRPAATGAAPPGPVSGPRPLAVALTVGPEAPPPSGEAMGEAWAAVPLVRRKAAGKAVAELAPDDVGSHVVVPGAWVPRGGVLVAYRMADSGMAPMIPLGATVVVDRRATDFQKNADRVVALLLRNKTLRIRRLLEDPTGGGLSGAASQGGGLGLGLRPEEGDRLLGRVVGMLSVVG